MLRGCPFTRDVSQNPHAVRDNLGKKGRRGGGREGEDVE